MVAHASKVPDTNSDGHHAHLPTDCDSLRHERGSCEKGRAGQLGHLRVGRKNSALECAFVRELRLHRPHHWGVVRLRMWALLDFDFKLCLPSRCGGCQRLCEALESEARGRFHVEPHRH